MSALKIYSDATFDKYKKVSYYGYCSGDFSIKRVRKGKFMDINAAEMAALDMAIEDLAGVDVVLFLTDSAHCVRIKNTSNVVHVSRALNIADCYVQMAKEGNRVSP